MIRAALYSKEGKRKRPETCHLEFAIVSLVIPLENPSVTDK